ncbi:hypothetical protein, partial [Peribacillus simplex]|uniref:hypothetical protein n=1 Tax=Peribacillus simplex TaxID=1478 RepID=UPI0036DBD6AB
KNCRLVSSRIMINPSLSLMFFYCNPQWIEEICDTPAELLASRDPQALVPRRLGRQSAERERISENQLER